MFDSLSTIENVRLNFSEGGLLFMNITLAFIMFGVSLEIKIQNFKEIFYKPKAAIIGITSQFIMLPALAFVLVMIINPPPSVAMGMILIAACPGGNISNFISSLAKANVALSVGLTAFATLSASLFTPLNFAFWGSIYVHSFSKAAELNIPIELSFLQMAKTVFILLGIPLILGMWFSRKFPKITKKVLKPIKTGSIIFYLIFIAGALYANLKFVPLVIVPLTIIVLLLNFETVFSGFIMSTIFRLSKADRRTVSIETGIQNSGLALVLIFNPLLFNGNGGMAFTAAWWGIIQMITGLLLALALSKMRQVIV